MAVLWPSFLVSGIATILFFTAFDPLELFHLENTSRLGAYSIGFFFFWLMSITSSLLTLYFQIPCQISDSD
jgi:multisubunit Na+/H+ antiporter MnhB subunit